MIIVINTKGQFNFQTRAVSHEVFNALQARGHIVEHKGYYGTTYSVEADTDTGYQQLISHSKTPIGRV